MTRVLVVAAAAVALSACGSVCSSAYAEQNRIFPSGTCSYTEGGFTINLKPTGSQSTCENGISKCNADDTKAIDAWVTCMKGVPACAAGAEKATADALTACAANLVDTNTGTSKLSADCQNAFK